MPPTTSMSATTTGITCTTACIPAKPSLSALCCSGDSSASTRARKVADCQFAMLTELSWQAKAPAHVAGQDLGDMCGRRFRLPTHFFTAAELSRPVRLRRRLLTRVAEGHVEHVSDIRPKFTEDVEPHARGEGITTHPQCGTKPALVPRMVDVVQSDGGHSSQPLRNIEHVLSAVALRHKGVLHCMEKTQIGRAS